MSFYWILLWNEYHFHLGNKSTEVEKLHDVLKIVSDKQDWKSCLISSLPSLDSLWNHLQSLGTWLLMSKASLLQLSLLEKLLLYWSEIHFFSCALCPVVPVLPVYGHMKKKKHKNKTERTSNIQRNPLKKCLKFSLFWFPLSAFNITWFLSHFVILVFALWLLQFV